MKSNLTCYCKCSVALNLSKFVAIIMEKFSVLFFQMIETNYVPIYMKINPISFVIKGQFPVMDYTCISNTITLFFHSTLYLCIMYILLHDMFALISYATCEWPEMYSFQ